MLLAGFLIGLGAQLLLPPGATAGRPPRVNPALLPRTGTDRAQASDPTTVQTPPGQPVQLTWVLTNTGTTTWKPIDFRFDPAEGEGPVIPLRPPLIKQFSLKQQKYLPVPVAMAPGVEVPVEVTLTAPAEPGIYPYAWQLIGPDGPVPGGRLAATLIVAPAEPAH
jgi:hypothetical protein